MYEMVDFGDDKVFMKTNKNKKLESYDSYEGILLQSRYPS